MRARSVALCVVEILGPLLASCSGAVLPRASPEQRPSMASPEQGPLPCTLELVAAAGEMDPVAEGTTPRFMTADLDGSGDPECVMVARIPVDDADAACSECAVDRLVVHRSRGGQWQEVAQMDVDASNDGGTIDYESGISQIGVERFAGHQRDALVLRRETGQGGYDPRFHSVARDVVFLVGDALAVLSCDLEREVYAGPWRSLQEHAERTMRVLPGSEPLTVRVEETTTELVYGDAEVGDEEPAPTDEIESHRSTRYELTPGGFIEQGETHMCETDLGG